MDIETHDLVRTTYEDLTWMRHTWVEDTISEDEMRRASTTLRRLTVDDAYSRAWRAVGLSRQPTVPHRSVEARLDAIPASAIEFAVFGGATGTPDEVLARGVITDVTPEDDPINVIGVREIPIGLSAFMASTALVSQGQRVSRRDVVKYVSNRLGGSHVGLRGMKAADREAVAVLDKVRGTPGEQMLPYYLLLTIGYAIAQSPDAAYFCRVATTRLR